MTTRIHTARRLAQQKETAAACPTCCWWEESHADPTQRGEPSTRGRCCHSFIFVLFATYALPLWCRRSFLVSALHGVSADEWNMRDSWAPAPVCHSISCCHRRRGYVPRYFEFGHQLAASALLVGQFSGVVWRGERGSSVSTTPEVCGVVKLPRRRDVHFSL